MARMTLAAKLQALRKNRQITQEQLANHLGVSAQAVSKWENGSYPDGDLIPRIADYFGVTIDELYGRSNGQVSLEQQIMESIQRLEEEDGNHSDILEQMMRYVWTFQLAAWTTTKEYYDRPVLTEADTNTQSSIFNENGFTLMRLNQNLEYFFLMKQPPNGFADYFEITDDLIELFRFLSDKDHVKIIYYMMSLKNAEMVRCSTVSKRLDIAADKVQKALNYLCRMEQTGMFYQGTMIDENEYPEKIYGTQLVKTSAFLLLLTGADLMIHQPSSYSMHVGNRNEAWMKRSNLAFLKKNEKYKRTEKYEEETRR